MTSVWCVRVVVVAVDYMWMQCRESSSGQQCWSDGSRDSWTSIGLSTELSTACRPGWVVTLGHGVQTCTQGLEGFHTETRRSFPVHHSR